MNSLQQAKIYVEEGWSIIPIGLNKTPSGRHLPKVDGKASWLPFRDTQATQEQIAKWYEMPGIGIGVICGRVCDGSANLLVLDIESQQAFDAVWELIKDEDPELHDLIEQCARAITPAESGRHVYLRLDHCPPAGTVLARDAAGGVLIETRGEGHYVCAPGTPGRCHPANKPYVWEKWLDNEDASLLKAAHVERILELARSFNCPRAEEKASGSIVQVEPSGGDRINARDLDWEPLLEGAGWAKTSERDGVSRWRRPGKDHGISATLGHAKSAGGNRLFHAFSSNSAPFEQGKTYSLFAATALLGHAGDFRACARSELGTRAPVLVAQGAKKIVAHNTAAPSSEPDRSDIVPFSSIPTRAIKWLWQDRIPRGMLSVIEGPPKRGKSLIMLDLAARVSTGAPMPTGGGQGGPSSVLIVNPEDAPESVVAPRLIAAGADRDRIFLHRGFVNSKGASRRPVLTDENLQRIENDIKEHNATLIVFDAVMGLFPSRIDTNSDSQARSVLEPLARMSERLEVAIVIGRHWSKGASNRASFERGIGSIAFTGVARSVLQVGLFPDDKKRRAIGVGAGNGRDCSVIEFRTEGCQVRLESGEIEEVPRITWAGACDLDIEDLDKRNDRGADTAEMRCSRWIVSKLQENGGEADSAALEAMAQAEGFSSSTLKRARLQLDQVQTVRSGKGWKTMLADNAAIERAKTIFESA